MVAVVVVVVVVGGGGGASLCPSPLLPQHTIPNVCKILRF